MFDYDLVRSKRKTVAIHLTPDAKVQVRAPLHANIDDIEKILLSKEKWVNDHLAILKQNYSEQSSFIIDYGRKARLFGEMFPILSRQGTHCGFDGECFFFPPGHSPRELKSMLISLYKKIARKAINDGVSNYAKQMSLTPTSVKLSSAKTRWGSCSSRNALNFSWRLVMADSNAINYVIVHELAHIAEHNHSDRFWAIVRNVMPDYEHRKLLLKELQEQLAKENWDI